MLTLAGLQRVRYVFVYPESGDLVLAGPAGDWKVDDGRIVAKDTLDPVVRLDDLLVLMRRGPDAAEQPLRLLDQPAAGGARQDAGVSGRFEPEAARARAAQKVAQRSARYGRPAGH